MNDQSLFRSCFKCSRLKLSLLEYQMGTKWNHKPAIPWDISNSKTSFNPIAKSFDNKFDLCVFWFLNFAWVTEISIAVDHVTNHFFLEPIRNCYWLWLSTEKADNQKAILSVSRWPVRRCQIDEQFQLLFCFASSNFVVLITWQVCKLSP